MKLTTRTLNILKNFASINSGLMLVPGKEQSTISSPSKAILVKAILDDDFPVEFTIYDLNQFLGIVTTLNDPDLTFTEKNVSVKDDNLTFTYNKCAPTMIVTPPRKELELDKVDVAFYLPNTILSKLLKIGAMTSLPHLSVLGKDGDILMQAHERSNDTSNFGWSKLGEFAGPNFTATFKTENIKLLPDDYRVELQVGKFAKFVNTAGNLTYFIALESK